jgi:hypothetical protein
MTAITANFLSSIVIYLVVCRGIIMQETDAPAIWFGPLDFQIEIIQNKE